MSVLAIPTLGPFHILHPRYNAVSVLEWVKHHQPSQIVIASYSPEELRAKTWRDANEVSFFHVLPWAQRAKVAVASLDPQAELRHQADVFRGALSQYPKGQTLLQQAAELEAGLQSFLIAPKTPADFFDAHVLKPVQDYLEGYAALFGEGPATGFRQQRMERVVEALQQERNQAKTLVLVDILDYPVLLSLLPAHSPALYSPTEAERQRSILDRAWRLEETDDWAALIGQLQEVDGPEAMYCAAQIYLAAGQPEDAFDLLEQLVHTDFQEPEYLPGYTLARYGQLADAVGNRDKALKAYQAALALSWIPQEAKEIALAGQKTPFKLGA